MSDATSHLGDADLVTHWSGPGGTRDPDCLILPFAALGDPPDPALLDSLALPQLQALLLRLREDGPALGGDPYSASAPHELALAQALGLPPDVVRDGELPWAALAQGVEGQACAWFVPCHFQVGMEQVSLLAPDRLALDEATSRALHTALAPLCAEDGVALHWVAPGRWLAVGAPLAGLSCASLDRVIGRGLDAWQPRAGHDTALANLRWLQRLQSEAQMLFYTHPANEAREARRLPIVNGVWVEGVGRAPALPARVTRPWVPGALRTAALGGSTRDWAQAWQAVDAGPLAQLRERAETGQAVTLWLCGERWARRFTPAPAARGLTRWFGGRRRASLGAILGSL